MRRKIFNHKNLDDVFTSLQLPLTRCCFSLLILYVNLLRAMVTFIKSLLGSKYFNIDSFFRDFASFLGELKSLESQRAKKEENFYWFSFYDKVIFIHISLEPFASNKFPLQLSEYAEKIEMRIGFDFFTVLQIGFCLLQSSLIHNSALIPASSYRLEKKSHWFIRMSELDAATKTKRNMARPY